MSDQISRLVYLPLAILTFAVILPVLGVWEGFFSGTKATVLVASLQAFASLLLILVTIQYAETTRDNVDLMSKQLNHEIRQKHTDVLRNRVEEWIGEGVVEDSSGIERPIRGTPYVNKAEVVTAPPNESMYNPEESFRIIPASLAGDRYLADLLENHAPDLRKICENILEGQQKYESLRSEFINEYDDVTEIEALPFTADPAVHFENWAFTRVVYLERTEWTRDDLYDMVDNAIQHETHGDQSYTFFPGDNNYRSVIKVPRDEEYDKESIAEALKEIIDRLSDHPLYVSGEEAANLLNEIDQDCIELRQTLIEYHGRLIYSGECEYLRESEIQ